MKGASGAKCSPLLPNRRVKLVFIRQFRRPPTLGLNIFGSSEIQESWAIFSADKRSSGATGEKNPDELSEDEKRTLVVGGWLRDTRRAIIEEESAAVLGNEVVKKLLRR